MWPATTLALSPSSLEANAAAQLAPMRWIERFQFGTDGHNYAASPSKAIDAGPTDVEPSRVPRLRGAPLSGSGAGREGGSSCRYEAFRCAQAALRSARPSRLGCAEGGSVGGVAGGAGSGAD